MICRWLAPMADPSAPGAAANFGLRHRSTLRHRPAGNLWLAPKVHLPARPAMSFQLCPDLASSACAADEYSCSAFPSSPELHQRGTARLSPAFSSLWPCQRSQPLVCTVGCTFWLGGGFNLRFAPAGTPTRQSGDSCSLPCRIISCWHSTSVRSVDSSAKVS